MSIFEELLLHHVVLQSIKYSPKTTTERYYSVKARYYSVKAQSLEKKINIWIQEGAIFAQYLKTLFEYWNKTFIKLLLLVVFTKGMAFLWAAASLKITSEQNI